MTIDFRKVPKEGFDFSVEKEGVTFNGHAIKEKGTLLKCTGNMQGVLEHACDRCGESLEIDLDDEVEVWASDGIITGAEDELMNIIEFAHEKVDFNEIMESEIEAIKSDYYYCPQCKKQQGE